MDGRVGFAEPAPGVELYFCPPHIQTHELLGKILPKDHIQELNTIDYGLIGIVVWRKAQLTSTISPTSASYSKHGSKKQHFSRRHQDRVSNMNAKFAPETRVPMNQLHNAPLPQPNEDDDDDVPPGFGPPVARDDDLPEFDFSGSNRQQMPNMPSRGPGAAAFHGRQSHRAVDQMRELVQKYGRPGSAPQRGSWEDDDDDIPEWQPQTPYSQPALRPHLGSRPPLGATAYLQSLQGSLGVPEQSIQPQMNMLQAAPARQQGSWGFPPSGGHGLQPPGGQLYDYGARGQSGLGWRRDPPSRGF